MSTSISPILVPVHLRAPSLSGSSCCSQPLPDARAPSLAPAVRCATLACEQYNRSVCAARPSAGQIPDHTDHIAWSLYRLLHASSTRRPPLAVAADPHACPRLPIATHSRLTMPLQSVHHRRHGEGYEFWSGKDRRKGHRRCRVWKCLSHGALWHVAMAVSMAVQQLRQFVAGIRLLNRHPTGDQISIQPILRFMPCHIKPLT